MAGILICDQIQNSSNTALINNGALAINSVGPTQLNTVTSQNWYLNGNLGIGTASPGYLLDINNTGGSQANARLNGNDQANVRLRLTNVGSGGQSFEIVGGNPGASNAGLAIYDVTNTATRMYIDSSGNVGIGTSSPSTYNKLTVLNGAITSGTTTSTSGSILLQGYYNSGSITNIGTEFSNGGPVIGYAVTPSTSAAGSFVSSTSVNTFKGAYTIAGNAHLWYGGAASTTAIGSAVTTSELMRIDSSGNLLIGTPTATTGETKLILSTNSGTTNWRVGPWSTVSTNFYITPNSATTGVYLSGTSATTWSSLSDERAKDIIEPIKDAVEKVCTLRAVIGKYKLDEENTRKSFLIAQDVQAVLPEAVNIANQENGYLGLSYSDVIPLLVASIQEQQALITDLTTRLTALEAK